MNFSLAWQTTRACVVGSVGIMLTLIYLAALFISALVYAYSTPVAAAQTLLAISGIATFFWWSFISSRLLKVLRDTDAWLLPAPTKAMGASVLLQMLITIIIPSALHALLGSGFLLAVISLTALSACGLLFMLLPRYLGITMTLLPSLFNKLVASRLLPPTDSIEFLAGFFALTLALVLLAMWRFFRLRQYEGDTSLWSAPMALMPDAANGWGIQQWSKSKSGDLIINGITFEPTIHASTPGSPALAMRMLLGTHFMPLTKRSRTKQMLIMAMAYLLLPLFMAFAVSTDRSRDVSTTAAMAAYWVCLIGIGISFSAVLVRLRTLYTRDNAELAELALLPGWTDKHKARRLLSGILVRHMAHALLLPIIIAVTALMFIETKDHDGFIILASLLGTCLLIGAGYVMNIISGNQPRAFLVALVFIAAFLISLIQLILSVQSKTLVFALFALPVWWVFLAIALAYLYFSWRPFLHRAHPFLRN